MINEIHACKYSTLEFFVIKMTSPGNNMQHVQGRAYGRTMRITTTGLKPSFSIKINKWAQTYFKILTMAVFGV